MDNFFLLTLSSFKYSQAQKSPRVVITLKNQISDSVLAITKIPNGYGVDQKILVLHQPKWNNWIDTISGLPLNFPPAKIPNHK